MTPLVKIARPQNTGFGQNSVQVSFTKTVLKSLFAVVQNFQLFNSWLP